MKTLAVVLLLMSASVALGAPKYEIFALKGDESTTGHPKFNFQAHYIDRVKSKVFWCYVTSEDSYNDSDLMGFCDALKLQDPPKMEKLQISILPQFPTNPQLWVRRAIWFINEETGKVTFCRTRCIDLPIRNE